MPRKQHPASTRRMPPPPPGAATPLLPFAAALHNKLQNDRKYWIWWRSGLNNSSWHTLVRFLAASLQDFGGTDGAPKYNTRLV